MSDSWQLIIRALFYGLEYEDDLPTRAQRNVDVIATSPWASTQPDEILRAIDQALACSADLPSLYAIAGQVVKQPYSDADLRRLLEDVSDRLRRQMARTGDPAPQAGIWGPADYSDRPRIVLTAGERLPEHEGGRWWRLIPEQPLGERPHE